MHTDSGFARVGGHGKIRMVDNIGIEDDSIALQSHDNGRLELIGNQYVSTDHVGMWLSGQSVADFQSGSLVVSEHDAVWIDDRGRLNYRGGSIRREGQALNDARRVDFLIRGGGSLHLYAFNASFDGQRAAGTLRDGNTFDFKITADGRSSVVIHDLAAFDFHPDGTIDALDIDMLGEVIHQGHDPVPPEFDVDQSGELDSRDVESLVRDIYGADFGDANLDGYFDSKDIIEVLVAGTYKQEIDANWESGDWNQDTRFDSSDITLALQTGKYLPNHGLPPEPVAVPEPNSAVYIIYVLLLLSRSPGAAPR